MKSQLSLLSAGLLVLPLALAACGSGSGGSGNESDLPKPTPAKSPNEPNAVPTKGTPVPKKVDTNNKSSDSNDKKAEPAPAPAPAPVPAPEPTPTIDPLQSIQGSYFSSEFYSGPTSRSLVITGDKFVSTVRGKDLILGLAEQIEEGSVAIAADGNVSLIVEKSSCEGHSLFDLYFAKTTKFTHLRAGEDSLEFKDADEGRDRSMKRDKATLEFDIEDGKVLRNACWFEIALGDLFALAKP